MKSVTHRMARLLLKGSVERDWTRSEILESNRCPESAAHCREKAVTRETMARLRNEPRVFERVPEKPRS
jgi:hypothetical protein